MKNRNIFKDWLNGGYADWNQKQLLSLIFVVLVCLIISLIVYVKIKKDARPDKAPSGFILIMEGYVNYIDHSFDDSTDYKIPKARFYIFGLATFLFLGNILGMIGLEPITSSYSVAIALALVTWLGIYITALIYQKWRFIGRYKNPIEIVGQFSPLISASFRIFGNIIGGGTIVFMLYYFCGYLWTLIIPGSEAWPLLAVIFTPFLHIYFDLFSAFIQALVFCSLTTIWWSQEVPDVVIAKSGKSISLEKTVEVAHSNLSKNIY
ncbi:F0F1 ATP synthase subunit A [Mycoplasma tauri]|uniref:F0F1 ATP synthase subunit A n=1 Tax=Mycoplasma tauri TaxID=547987 RepID=A0A953NH69_9MOLU|nr:F0F1 ATP synthase subunit A [Mycoplasma tauri]MBZ4195611.1 F0F1 ATP synthase subunit A [Mycoplasma tauri]MBZ4203785.1 F0F1 ATP synthase subunit A [Mycoplasma tauri]MBZ4204444.1 F0F1 ATP synthase subunit A [Mycoplasma tauri]MBZ4226916.1 F0F1 ATP synthase subunit A [Mycoplasma tauri]QSB07781.1 F0F1 ATP synthase subunit A [Mycoplasma tauri]